MREKGVGLEEGYTALLEACGFVGAPVRDWLVASGDDRLRFLNGLVTSDVRGLNPGSGAYGFFTSRKGKVIADVGIWAGEAGLLLDVPAGAGPSIAEHMLGFRVADRVEVAAAASEAEIMVAGALARETLAESLGERPPESAWEHRRISNVHVLHEDRLGVPLFRLRGPDGAISRIRAAMVSAGVGDVAAESVDAVRVERGLPLFGVDFDEECFPQETGLEGRAVSYSKGCYLGQEVVARIHYRGHVNRRLRGLRAESGGSLAAGDVVLAGEVEVGRVSTAVLSPTVGARIGLAILHRKAEEARTEEASTEEAKTEEEEEAAAVRLRDGTPLTIVELPFVDRGSGPA